MMPPIFCTLFAGVLGMACLSVRLAAAPYSRRVLPWSVGAFGFLAFAGWGVQELLS